MDRAVDYYKNLYKLQDKVMNIVFKHSNEFYLTGGTAINRFYKECRYSDDLDFFTNFSNIFNLDVRNIKQELSEAMKIKTIVESKDFIRFVANDLLQIDFVNDRVKRCDKVEIKNEFIVDNIENIFANKLTAIIGRDSAKDIFDVFVLDKYFTINYQKVLYCAKEKMEFLTEDLIFRLKTFPVSMLKELNIANTKCQDDFTLKNIINSINLC